MSGGRWNYAGRQVLDILAVISEDKHVITRWPSLGGLLCDLGKELCRVEKFMDWDLSGDSSIRDDRKFEQEAVQNMYDIVSKAREALNAEKRKGEV
jgi:hypothetical protein